MALQTKESRQGQQPHRHPESDDLAASHGLEEVRAAWDRIAEGYDQFVTPSHIWLATQALSQAGLEKGMRFLDVACGSGAMSIPAARLGAEVTSTDISPAMVELVRARARRAGHSNLSARVMDGHALDLEDDSFDMSGSQFGVMLFPDLPRALREMARVTRPGGRVVLVVYGDPREVEFLGFFMGAAKSVVPDFTGLPLDPPPLPFQMADPDRLHRALADVGPNDVRVETITEELEFRTGEELWAWLLNSNPIPGTLVADLTDEQKKEVEKALDRLVRERSAGNGPAVLTNPVHIGIATK